MCILCQARDLAAKLDADVRNIDGDGFLNMATMRADLAAASALLTSIRDKFKPVKIDASGVVFVGSFGDLAEALTKAQADSAPVSKDKLN